MSAVPDGSWWSHPDLERVWVLIAERLERAGLEPRGRVSVGDLDRTERRALSDLLGHGVLRDRERVDLGALDVRLRSRAGLGVVAAAETVLARALTDRPAARAARAARREEPRTAYDGWVTEHPETATWRLEEWIDGLRRDGVLARDPDPAALVRDALSVLWSRRASILGEDEVRPIARTQLAAELFGDAHALDDDRRLAAVVLRAGRVLATDGDAAHQREEWERLGVLTDRVSTTCLTLGLRSEGLGPRPWSAPAGGGEDPVSARVDAYRVAGAVLHLTWRDLDAGLRFAAGQSVLVSENPRVVEAAAELQLDDVGFVSTGGRPSLVTLEVLSRLSTAGARLLYHGDFDWAGVAIANDLVHRLGVLPWRMSADDYLALPARLPLHGTRVEAAWDGELSAAMAHRGLAVHEEAALPQLLHALSG